MNITKKSIEEGDKGVELLLFEATEIPGIMSRDIAVLNLVN